MDAILPICHSFFGSFICATKRALNNETISLAVLSVWSIPSNTFYWSDFTASLLSVIWQETWSTRNRVQIYCTQKNDELMTLTKILYQVINLLGCMKCWHFSLNEADEQKKNAQQRRLHCNVNYDTLKNTYLTEEQTNFIFNDGRRGV